MTRRYRMTNKDTSWKELFTMKKIAYSLFITLLTAGILWVLSIIGPYVVNILMDISDSFIQHYYKRVSSQDLYMFSRTTSILMIVALSMILALFIDNLENTKDRKVELIKNLLHENIKLESRTEVLLASIDDSSKEKPSKVDPENISKEIEKIQNEIESDKKVIENLLTNFKIQSARSIIKFSLPSLVLILFMLVNFYIDAAISFDIREFNKNMAYIKPYTTSNEYDLLISEWSQIKNEADFDLIMNKIESIKAKNVLGN